MNDCKEIRNCLCCKNPDIRTILDLGQQPLANSYCSSKEEKEHLYPLKLNFCINCFHLQNSHRVNPEIMFKNYLYVSGTTKTLKDYFDYFANFTKNLHNKPISVLDIACNDGTQLDSFKKLGLKTYGIDPAENLYKLSSKNHEIVCDFFNQKSIKKLNNKKFSIITAQNVFAHTTDVDDFLKCCKKIMDKNSLLFIQTSQSEMVKKNEFDTVYHEHISFFNIHSMKILLQRNGLYLADVKKVSVHGISYVFVITKNEKKQNNNIELYKEEKNNKLYNEMTYYEYSLECQKVVLNLKNKINFYKNSGYLVVGYGAAAKGNTLLNFGKIDLDFIVDDNELKQNLYTPGRKIKIISIKEFKNISNKKNVVLVPLAWNFYNEIKNRIFNEQIQDVCCELKMIKYFPSLFEENIK